MAVLVSGRGTNLQALIDACAAPEFPAGIEIVISNVATAPALERARSARIVTATIDHTTFRDRQGFEGQLLAELHQHRVELICLAGFMRILSPQFLRSFPGKILNIHPALLPAFPGLHGARQALVHGVKIAGCTVHLVDEGTDSGPIIVQAAVPVLPDDTEAILAERILVEEHRLYPMALRWICEGKVTLEGRVTKVKGQPAIIGHCLENPSEPSKQRPKKLDSSV